MSGDYEKFGGSHIKGSGGYYEVAKGVMEPPEVTIRWLVMGGQREP